MQGRKIEILSALVFKHAFPPIKSAYAFLEPIYDNLADSSWYLYSLCL